MKPCTLKLSAGLLLLLTGGLATLPIGCGQAVKTKTTDKVQKIKTDPWQTIASAFRNDVDAQAGRQLLADLNTGLAANTEADRPASATTAELKAIGEMLRLNEPELKFLAFNDYQALDANYLIECLYLRDVAASLGLEPTEPVSTRATVALRWIARHVQLRPWLLSTQQGQTSQPPLPPTFVLRRGTGSSLERAYIFLALCRQLDIDACLIGTAVSDQTWTYSRGDAGVAYPEGPFWAVGVRDGTEIKLFDPVRGEPFPGKGTLAEVRANSAILAEWRNSPTNKWAVTDGQIQGAEVYITAPISALTARCKSLDDRLRGETNARLSFDAVALAERLRKASGGVNVSGWNPPSDPFTPVRCLDTFLPPERGGGTLKYQSGQLYTQYLAQIIIFAKQFAFPSEVKNADALRRLQMIAVNAYTMSFQPQVVDQAEITWSPREKIQRGRHIEATKELMELKDRFRQAFSNRGKGSVESEVTNWSKEITGIYEQLSKAKVSEQASLQVPLLNKQIDEFWKKTLKTQDIIMTDILATPGAAEATYLIALSFHERAEKAQVEVNRFESTDPNMAAAAKARVTSDWKTAADWWNRYEEFRTLQGEIFPGREIETKILAERAQRLATGK
jgi:hypothetical protein